MSAASFILALLVGLCLGLGIGHVLGQNRRKDYKEALKADSFKKPCTEHDLINTARRIVQGLDCGDCLYCPAYPLIHYPGRLHHDLFGIEPTTEDEEYVKAKRAWFASWLAVRGIPVDPKGKSK